MAGTFRKRFLLSSGIQGVKDIEEVMTQLGLQWSLTKRNAIDVDVVIPEGSDKERTDGLIIENLRHRDEVAEDDGVSGHAGDTARVYGKK